jgi:hypothetical protein
MIHPTKPGLCDFVDHPVLADILGFGRAWLKKLTTRSVFPFANNPEYKEYHAPKTAMPPITRNRLGVADGPSTPDETPP